jgi:hypothetical protein
VLLNTGIAGAKDLSDAVAMKHAALRDGSLLAAVLQKNCMPMPAVPVDF